MKTLSPCRNPALGGAAVGGLASRSLGGAAVGALAGNVIGGRRDRGRW